MTISFLLVFLTCLTPPLYGYCTDENQISRSNRETWRKECNTCRCIDDTIRCTKLNCDGIGGDKPCECINPFSGSNGNPYVTCNNKRNPFCYVDCEADCDDIGAGRGNNRCFSTGACHGLPGYCREIVTRYNVLDISVSEFDKYSETLGKMKKQTGPLAFQQIAQYHGKPFFCNKYQTRNPKNYTQAGCCISHYGQDDRIGLFTPWHRLLMAQMEFAFKKDSLSNPLGIPYWDWTNPNIPDANGLPPLSKYKAWRWGEVKGTNCITERNIVQNITWDSLRTMTKTAFMQETFCDFNFQIVQPHNTVHREVGGNMNTFDSSSYDPIFYLHHSYVDLQYAYFQELQKLRKRKIVVKDPEYMMQPFDRDTNPYKKTQIHSTSYETEDYRDTFCYKFDSLKFMNLTPKQFIQHSREIRREPSLYAAHVLKETRITSLIKFDLFFPATRRRLNYVGTLTTFGSTDNIPDYSEPKFPHTLLHDVTYLLTDPEIDPTTDKTLTFEVSQYTDKEDNDLNITETYKPVIVYRAANSDILVYRFHEEHIQLYAPKQYIKIGSKVEFLKTDGSYSTATFEILSNTNDTEYTEPVTEELSIQKLEHTFRIQNEVNTTIKVGYYVGCLVKCPPPYSPGESDPISLDPDYLDVVNWSNTTNGFILRNSGDLVMLAWCRGTKANVYKFGHYNDYRDCNIPSNATTPWEDEHGPHPSSVRGYVIDTNTEEVQYFANGVGDVCKNGWKITVIVL